MALVFQVLAWAVQLYIWLFIARFIVDLVRSVNPTFRPTGLMLILLESILTVTDPPLKLVRRFVRPFRVGSLALDFGWTIVILVLSLIHNVLVSASL